MNPERTNNDHDLLIRVDENLKNLMTEFKLMRDDSGKRLTLVETTKMDKVAFEDFLNREFKDHETRLRRAERFLYMGLGIIGLFNFILLMIAAFKH